MSESYLDLLRRALGNTAGPAGFLLNENAPFVEFLRRRLTPTARPATPTAAQPAAPTTPTAPTTPPEPARRPPVQATPTEETPETFEAMRQFQADLIARRQAGQAPEPAQQSQQQLSVLDMLRKRAARDMEGEALQRVAEFGQGMLASGSPNFFTMLGAGAQAARQGDISRTDRLRQLAEAERQDAAQRAEEAYRRDQARIQSERYAAEAPLRAAQARQADAMANFYTQGGPGAARGQVTPAVRIRAEGQVLTEARALFPDPPRDALNREALVAQVEQQRRNYMTQRLPGLIEALATPGQVTTPSTTGGGAANQPAPAAVLDLSGRPTR